MRQSEKSNNRTSHERVDSVINSRFDGYMVKAREARLSKTELSLLRLLICGFSSSQIGVILDVGQGALSTRKSRLKGKIENLGLPEMPCI